LFLSICGLAFPRTGSSLSICRIPLSRQGSPFPGRQAIFGVHFIHCMQFCIPMGSRDVTRFCRSLFCAGSLLQCQVRYVVRPGTFARTRLKDRPPETISRNPATRLLVLLSGPPHWSCRSAVPFSSLIHNCGVSVD